jgi:hypothetical protein
LLRQLSGHSRSDVLPIARRLVQDDSEDVRDEALTTISLFGLTGIEILKEELSGPAAKRLLLTQALPQALTKLGRLTAPIEPLLLSLGGQDDESMFHALIALGRLISPSTQALDFATNQLGSDDLRIREAALNAIFEMRSDLSELPSQAWAAVVLNDVTTRYKERLGSIIDVIRPWFRDRFNSGPLSFGLPDFPWPPPAWSHKTIIPIEILGPYLISVPYFLTSALM